MAKKEIEKKEYTPQDFMTSLEIISRRMGYSLDHSIEPFKQDNGSYSFKVIVSVVKRQI